MTGVDQTYDAHFPDIPSAVLSRVQHKRAPRPSLQIKLWFTERANALHAVVRTQPPYRGSQTVSPALTQPYRPSRAACRSLQKGKTRRLKKAISKKLHIS